ncbi:MAG TPA: PIG-L family deacetylase [Opitutaceae bacterium]
MRLRSRHFSSGGALSFLVVSPHPDDETFGCGGTIAGVNGAGATVHVLFVTNGDGSHPNHPSVGRTDLASLRAAEARAATRILGVEENNLTFMGIPDGTLGHLESGQREDAVRAISGLIGRIRPDVILVPCRGDGSSEHDAAFQMGRRAAEQSGLRPRLLEYPVWSWWSPVLLLGHLFRNRRIWRIDLRGFRSAKAKAISAYASQLLPIPPQSSAALPVGFASLFDCPEEFLFEQ